MKSRSTADAQRQGIKQGVNGMMATMIIVLYDKYGWRDKELERFRELVNTQWEACLDGYVTVDDLLRLADECLPRLDKRRRNNCEPEQN